MSGIAYHLLEFEIARATDDPRRVMPVLSDRDGRILDIGCGAGQTLIACDLKPGVFACGVDIDEEALALSRRMSNDIALARAKGEQLPFADRSFDFVISRLSLPYMRIPDALGEIARVLKPGGQVWFLLHSISMALRGVARSLRRRNVKNLIYQHYVIANGLLFHFTGRQFHFPFAPDKCESFQTRRGIVRAMLAAGFEDVRVERDRFFIVTASKRGGIEAGNGKRHYVRDPKQETSVDLTERRNWELMEFRNRELVEFRNRAPERRRSKYPSPEMLK